MKINEIISEYTLQGRTCTKDCSGHRAGWYWAKSKGVTNPVSCDSRSPSFNGGCSAAAEYPAMKHPRIRGEKGRFARPVPVPRR